MLKREYNCYLLNIETSLQIFCNAKPVNECPCSLVYRVLYAAKLLAAKLFERLVIKTMSQYYPSKNYVCLFEIFK